jgi:hypothetical protein
MDKLTAKIGCTPPPPPVFKGYQIEVYLKSGHTIKFRCEDFTVKINALTGEYVGYEVKDLKEPRQVDFDTRLIAGYIVK